MSCRDETLRERDVSNCESCMDVLYKKLSNFLCQYYGQIYVSLSFLKSFDQILILLLLLCVNLEE
jgi:hypothetical protein